MTVEPATSTQVAKASAECACEGVCEFEFRLGRTVHPRRQQVLAIATRAQYAYLARYSAHPEREVLR